MNLIIYVTLFFGSSISDTRGPRPREDKEPRLVKLTLNDTSHCDDCYDDISTDSDLIYTLSNILSSIQKPETISISNLTLNPSSKSWINLDFINSRNTSAPIQYSANSSQVPLTILQNEPCLDSHDDPNHNFIITSLVISSISLVINLITLYISITLLIYKPKNDKQINKPYLSYTSGSVIEPDQQYTTEKLVE